LASVLLPPSFPRLFSGCVLVCLAFCILHCIRRAFCMPSVKCVPCEKSRRRNGCKGTQWSPKEPRSASAAPAAPVAAPFLRGGTHANHFRPLGHMRADATTSYSFFLSSLLAHFQSHFIPNPASVGNVCQNNC